MSEVISCRDKCASYRHMSLTPGLSGGPPRPGIPEGTCASPFQAEVDVTFKREMASSRLFVPYQLVDNSELLSVQQVACQMLLLSFWFCYFYQF